jgi:CzcA family heavy metal efflux pump
MLRWAVGLSLQFRALLLLLAAGVIVVGVAQLRTNRVDLLPELMPPIVEVQTEALGLAPAEVEGLITAPLEEILSGVPWLQSMRSKSIASLSSVVLVFDEGTDLMRARQLVQERLLHATVLPKVSKPPTMLQPVSSNNRALKIGLSSETLSLIDVSVLARWKIKPWLMGVPGVANVAIWGQRDRQLQVQIDPARLRDNGVHLDDIIKATGDALWVSPLTFLRASTPGTGGFIDTPSQRLDVRHVLPIRSPDDLSRISFPGPNGATLRLADVATVVEGHPPMIGDAIVDGKPGLMLVVEKLPGANTLEVTEGLEKALEALKPALPGVKVDSTVFRPATFIQASNGNLTTALIGGSILLVLAFVAFFGRVALIGVVSVALPLLTAVLVLGLLGATINTMILAGLAIALVSVVDDAVVDIENIVRRLRESRHEDSAKSLSAIVLEGSIETRQSVLFATLIVVLAVLPIFLIEGGIGALLEPLALSYMLALLASMIVALSVTPALSLTMLSHVPLDERQLPLVRSLQGHYERILSRVIRAPRLTFLVTVAAVLLGCAALPLLTHSRLPVFKERDFPMQWVAKPGTSHVEMSRLVSEATQKLRSIPGVRNVAAHVGRAVQSDVVATVNTAELWISLLPSADYDKTLTAIQEVADGYPGLSKDSQSFATATLRKALTGSNEPILIRIYGPEFGVLRGKADEVLQALAGIDGIVAPKVLTEVEEPSIEIEVNLAAAERHGIKPGDVRRAASTVLAGIEVGSLYEQQKIFDVVVWGTPETRRNVDDIRHILIDTPHGNHVRLGEVAGVRLRSNPTTISRQGAARYVDVVAGVQRRDLGSITDDVRRRLQEINFPREYHPEVIGGHTKQQAAQTRVVLFLIAAAIGVLFLLQAAFGSWRLAFASYLLLPSALVGGVLAAIADGTVVSLGSLAGLLAVLGIAARSTILLINRFQHLEQHEGEPFGPGLIMRGARERLSPVVMTALTTAGIMISFVLLGQVSGNEIGRPMAMVIIGGLASTILVNLFVVPALYTVLRPRIKLEIRTEAETAETRGMRYAAE